MTSDVIDQATHLYVFVDDFLKARPLAAFQQRRPAFTDAEDLAIGLMQGSLGMATLRKTHEMIRDNIGVAFPRLRGYKKWGRLHGLAFIAGRLVKAAFVLVALSPVRLYLLDSKPVSVCKPVRHGRVRLSREAGA